MPTLFTLKTILRDGVYLPVLHDPGCAATQISISLFHKEAIKSCYIFIFSTNYFIYTKKVCNTQVQFLKSGAQLKLKPSTLFRACISVYVFCLPDRSLALQCWGMAQGLDLSYTARFIFFLSFSLSFLL